MVVARSGGKPCPICASPGAVPERTLNSVRLLRCASCDFVYADLDDAAIESANSTYGAEVASSYAAAQSVLDLRWFERIARRFTTSAPGGRVLDVGCGNGLLLRSFRERGWQSEGVDPSPWARPFAKLHGHVLHADDLVRCGLPDGAYDVVTNTSTLEHVPRPRQHLDEIVRILRPGGVAYLAGIPNYGALPVRIGIASFHCNTPPGHVNYFTPATLARLLVRLDRASELASASVRSYGVPEAFFVLDRLGAAWRACTRTGAPTAAPDTVLPTPPGRPTRTRRAMASLLVAANYHLGRPLGMGDKIEAVLVRRR